MDIFHNCIFGEWSLRLHVQDFKHYFAKTRSINVCTLARCVKNMSIQPPCRDKIRTRNVMLGQNQDGSRSETGLKESGLSHQNRDGWQLCKTPLYNSWALETQDTTWFACLFIWHLNPGHLLIYMLSCLIYNIRGILNPGHVSFTYPCITNRKWRRRKACSYSSSTPVCSEKVIGCYETSLWKVPGMYM